MRRGAMILRPTAALLMCSVHLLILLPLGATAVRLSLPSSGTKCVTEEIQPNVVVLAKYLLVPKDHTRIPTLAVKVTSPYGNTLHHQENATIGQFAFTTTEAGNYVACFSIDSSDEGAGAGVNLDWRIGIAAKDWDSVAKKEKIEGVELELRKLEDTVESIHQNLLYIRTRETEMREVSERTYDRVAWLSIMSLSVCIIASALQLGHLKRFFQKKKLI
ncbi:transmembrane emp24 domain-containing protein p24delta3 [Elaeis guineensis]|uniref:Transmembrane emp24 domain-containing protein p24delta3 n=1 Tax=Elaeis guineensis var. tenera TaxID=51953 RepID=A0A6I9S9B7_ELAGV|nr:transmembrane emp24 domain-containing protein p24delta3 [Elaeis guineensis]